MTRASSLRKKLKAQVPGATALNSPWLNAAVTSCIFQPSMSHIGAGTVVRDDGSLVGG